MNHFSVLVSERNVQRQGAPLLLATDHHRLKRFRVLGKSLDGPAHDLFPGIPQDLFAPLAKRDYKSLRVCGKDQIGGIL